VAKTTYRQAEFTSDGDELIKQKAFTSINLYSYPLQPALPSTNNQPLQLLASDFLHLTQ